VSSPAPAPRRPLAERIADARAAQKLRARKTGVDAQVMLKAEARARDGEGAGDTSREFAQKGPMDDLTTGQFGLTVRKKVDQGQVYDELKNKFVEQELRKLRGEASERDAEEEREREMREMLKIPDNLKAHTVDQVTVPGQWTTGMQEVGISTADRLAVIERTEAAKGELLGKARLLGVEDDAAPEARKGLSRNEAQLPFAFGKKRSRR